MSQETVNLLTWLKMQKREAEVREAEVRHIEP